MLAFPWAWGQITSIDNPEITREVCLNRQCLKRDFVKAFWRDHKSGISWRVTFQDRKAITSFFILFINWFFFFFLIVWIGKICFGHLRILKSKKIPSHFRLTVQINTFFILGNFGFFSETKGISWHIDMPFSQTSTIEDLLIFTVCSL